MFSGSAGALPTIPTLHPSALLTRSLMNVSLHCVFALFTYQLSLHRVFALFTYQLSVRRVFDLFTYQRVSSPCVRSVHLSTVSSPCVRSVHLLTVCSPCVRSVHLLTCLFTECSLCSLINVSLHCVFDLFIYQRVCSPCV